MKANYLKNGFLWFHIVWAIAGVSVCYVFTTLEGGHPTGIVFVPITATIWLIGHMLLWLSYKITVQSKYFVDDENVAGGKWPLLLVFFTVLIGIVFILAINFLASFFI